MQVVFDIETDGFYRECTKVHCIALRRIGIDENILLFDTIDNNIEEGLKILSEADTLIGHNIIQYDIPVLEKLHPEFIYTHNVIDTLNLSSIVFPLMNSHGLDTWGKELGFDKLNPVTGQEYTKEELKIKKKIKNEAWSNYTKEMGAYCKQDVRITELVLWRCNENNIIEEKPYVIELSNKFAWIISEQIINGCRIDIEGLLKLNEQILQDENEAKEELMKMLPTFIDYEFQVVKRNNKNKNLKAGDIICKRIETEFNLKSTYHWMRFLKEKYNYEPPKIRRKGKDEPTASLNDDVLAELDYPEVKQLLKYKVATKIRGMIYSDPNSIYKLLDENNIIHGKLYTEGTVSGRCAHNNPNLSVMPRIRKNEQGIAYGIRGKYAYEVRNLFIARDGFTFVGFDAKALEVMCLAHYMNNKDFIKEVENGDIHTWTKNKAQLQSRRQAKLLMYSLLYGAGLGKLAQWLSEDDELAVNMHYTTADARRVRDKFYEEIPELFEVQNRIKEQYHELGGIIGLDGRLLQARSDYILLNLLLQSSGTVLMKQCLVFLEEELQAKGLKHRQDYNYLLNVHDEVEAEVRTELIDIYKECVYKAVDRTNDFFKTNCKLQIDLKTGRSWAECH